MIINEINKQISLSNPLSIKLSLVNLLPYPLMIALGAKRQTMKKVILITGSTDGIGLETAKELAALGHKVLIHGRNEQKLTDAKQAIRQLVEDAD